MKTFKKAGLFVAKKAGVVGAGISALTASTMTFAEADANITSAVTAGSDNVTAVVAGVIAVTALGFGLSMIVSWLRK
ncbi:hypothetical protein F9817_08535 [Vibrio sp. CAIM 722]|uniref:Uncharacterized protein n=1 Tax=Vibrio eleionomae TaxID=2653505 RepID=A0A7X4LJT9_9VIBR|nr:hypothetical protein [Vibrio eleionomae]MZI93242.1 hypothetical protein [Vibrio eleionomae]